jgi:hypothetical protein
MTDKVKHTKVNLYDFFFANKVRKTYTNVGITLLLTIVLVLFAIRPTLTTIQGIKNKITDYKAQNNKALNKINAEKALQKQINFGLNDTPGGLREAIEFVRKAFLQNDSYETIYTNIYSRANKHNIVIRSIVPSAAVANSANSFDMSSDAPSESSFDLNVSFEGKDIKEVQAFLETLEGSKNFPIFSRIKTITINDMMELNKVEKVLDENKRQQVIEFNVVFTIYTVPSES